MTSLAISVHGLTVGYDDGVVLDGIDLEVPAGQVVAVLGENGSGKSTLVKAMLGLVPVASGDIRVFGRPLGRDARRRIGYVPQRGSLTLGVPTTVRDVVEAGRVARRRWLRPLTAADRTAVREALDAVRLGDRAGDRLSDLSGGQQRRALIARALAGQPDLLVMDEPTAGVDAVNVELLAEAVGTWKARGLTVVVVAHGTGPLTPHVDRALVLQGGRVRYDGPIAPVPAGGPVVGGDDHHHVVGDPAPHGGLPWT